jgi:hypothetical protein
MLQGNPHKRMLKTETTIADPDGSPFPTRTVIPLNEIRSSDLEFDSATETLQIVDDVIVVVPQPPAPVVVPESVDMAQLREELSKSAYDVAEGVTLRDAVQTTVDDAGIVIQDWWATAVTVRRINPKVQAIQTGLGISDEVMDAIWVGATKN